MAFSAISSVVTGGVSTGVTSSAINTTGANLIVVAVASNGPSIEPPTTDNQSNVWSALPFQGGAGARCRLWYCVNPVTNSSHTFSALATGCYSSIAVVAFSGSKQAPIDKYSGFHQTGSSTTSTQPGSITPSVDNCLIVTAISLSVNMNSASVSGYTVLTVTASNGVRYGVGLAYINQTSATAVNPTWTHSNGANQATIVTSFKPDLGHLFIPVE